MSAGPQKRSEANTAGHPEETISIAMCTYNGERYLQEQLDSFAAQSRLPDELVAHDDSSTDATMDILSRFARHAPFSVRVYRNEKNLGIAENFASAIRTCKGTIIALSDQDDVWHPRKLELLQAKLQAKPQVAAVHSDADLADTGLRDLGRRLWENLDFAPADQRMAEAGGLAEILLNRNVVTGATFAFRAAYRKLVLPIPSDCIHDAWIAVLLAATMEWTLVPEPLISYRQHTGNQIGGQAKSFRKGLRNTSVVYAREAAFFRSVRERLLTHPEQPAKPGFMEKLDAKIVHLETRAHLPRVFFKRWPIVLRELATDRYRMYSSGWSSVAKDLWRGDAA